MNRLLLLLPLLALGGCSGNHDLMSTGAFRMVCDYDGSKPTWTISPELTVATFREEQQDGSFFEEEYDLVAVTPTRLKHQPKGTDSSILSINRETGKVVVDWKALEEKIDLNCSFKSL